MSDCKLSTSLSTGVSFKMAADIHILKLEHVCTRLKTDAVYGLSSKKAKSTLQKKGANEYSRPGNNKKKNFIHKMFGLKKTTDSWSKQEWNRVFNANLDDVYIVVRDGQRTLLQRRDLVRGDVIYLHAKQIIPADARVISCDEDLVVDNRLITGNPREMKSISATSNDPLLSQNMIFAFTELIKGCCEAIVTRTGNETVFGEMSRFATKVRYVKQHSYSQSEDLVCSSIDSESSIDSTSLSSCLSISGDGSSLESNNSYSTDELTF